VSEPEKEKDSDASAEPIIDGAAANTEHEATPVVPRTKSVAIDQTLAATENSESPDKPASVEPAAQQAIAPSALRDIADTTDKVAMPRTMSEEWMARDADDGAYEEEPRRPRWMIPAIIGGIAAIGLVVMLALGGNDDSATRPSAVAREEQVGSAPASSALTAVVQVDASIPVVQVDATEVTPVSAVVPIDAPQLAVTPTDAALVVDAVMPVDASVPANAVETKPTSKPDTTVTTNTKAAESSKKPITKQPKPPAPPKDERTIEQLVDANEFAKANTACAANTLFSTPRLAACAIAACNTQSTALATRWIRALPRASRDEMIAKCKSLGVEVATP
jgi:hypothetical protein